MDLPRDLPQTPHFGIACCRWFGTDSFASSFRVGFVKYQRCGVFPDLASFFLLLQQTHGTNGWPHVLEAKRDDFKQLHSKRVSPIGSSLDWYIHLREFRGFYGKFSRSIYKTYGNPMGDFQSNIYLKWLKT